MKQTTEDIRQGAEASYDRIRSDDTLSATGKRTQIGRTYVAAKSKLDDLRSASRSSTEADRLRYMRTAFAAPTDSASVLSYRDATDRAHAVESADAGLALINRAVDTGDTLLARAVGQRAYDEVKGAGAFANQTWLQVLQAYADSCTSSVEDAINGLLKQQRQADDNSFIGMLDYMLVKPSELAGLSDYDLAAL